MLGMRLITMLQYSEATQMGMGKYVYNKPQKYKNKIQRYRWMVYLIIGTLSLICHYACLGQSVQLFSATISLFILSKFILSVPLCNIFGVIMSAGRDLCYYTYDFSVVATKGKSPHTLWGNSYDHSSYDHTRWRTSATVSSGRVDCDACTQHCALLFVHNTGASSVVVLRVMLC